MPPQLPQWSASPSSVALGWEDRLGGGVQAQGAPTMWGSCGWTRPGAHDRWRGASSGQRRSRLWARRWVALPGRPAPNLLRGGRLSARLGERGAPLSPQAPCVLGRISPGEPTPHLNVRLSFTCPCIPHGNSSRRVGWGGNKVFPSWSGRGRGWAGPSRPQTPWLDCALCHPGGSALARCQPRRRPMADPARPLPPASPSPSPPPPPARTGPASPPFPRRGRCSPRLPPAPSSGALASFQPGSASGGARDSEGGRGGGPGHLSPPNLQAAPTPGAETQGKARTRRPAEGRAPLISHASHVWGRPAAFSSFPPLLSPPSPLGEGKVAVAAPCPGRSESRGRKWRTSR